MGSGGRLHPPARHGWGMGVVTRFRVGGCCWGRADLGCLCRVAGVELVVFGHAVGAGPVSQERGNQRGSND